MTQRMTMGARLAALLDQDGPVVAGGAYDGLSASILEEAGYPAVFMSGGGISASRGRVPDLGLLTVTELLGVVKDVLLWSDVPVIVDIDTGHGNEMNILRTIHELGRLGAAGIMLEDQVMPKRCGFIGEKSIIESSEFISKVRMAVAAANVYDMQVIARTDALAVSGIDEAIARCRAAEEVGAQLTLVEGPTTRAEVEQIADGVTGYKMYGLVSGRTPSLRFDELHAMNFRFLNIAGLCLIPAITAMREAAATVLAEQTDRAIVELAMGPSQIFDIVGLKEWDTLSRAILEPLNTSKSVAQFLKRD